MPLAPQNQIQAPVSDNAERQAHPPGVMMNGSAMQNGLASHSGEDDARASEIPLITPPKSRFSFKNKARLSPISADADDEMAQERGPQDVEAVVAVFRTLLLGMALLLPRVFAPQTFANDPESARWLMWLGVTAAAYNIAAVLASVFPTHMGLRRPLIIAMDALLVSGWVALSQQFGLFPFYGIVVVLAGLWGRAFGALVTAIGCDFLYLLVWANASSNSEHYVSFNTHMAISCVTLPIMGALVGYLVEMQERERQRHREGKLLIANYEREIDLSRQMQTEFFGAGRVTSPISDLDLGVAARTARVIGGGDFFDVLPLKDGSTLLCIADVSGKSARAQSRLPLLKYALRALAPLHPRPRDLVPQLNALISPELEGELYIAACCVRVIPHEHCLEWCNAGHIAPLLIRGGAEANATATQQISHLPSASSTRVTPLETSGPPLGMFEDVAYGFGSLPWHPGDAILLYTDGLSDAFSYEGAEDGEAQICGLAARLSSQEETARASAERLVDMAATILDTERQTPFLALPRLVGRHDSAKRALGSHRDDVTVAVARFQDAKVATNSAALNPTLRSGS